MTNTELRARAKRLVKEEQLLTLEIVELVAKVNERKAYIEYGYDSVFSWLTEELKYSMGAAQRRIDAARLLRDVPAVKVGIENGDLNLTALCKLQSAFRAEEAGREVTREEKAAAVQEVGGLTGFSVERKIAELFPASGEKAKRELHRATTDGDIRCTMNLSGEAFEDLKRVKELLSHRFPNATDAEVVAYALKFLLQKEDPLRKPLTATAAVKGRVTRHRAIHQKHGGQCSWVDPDTGTKCGSKYQVEIDHIKPKAKGGTDDPENLRLLCRMHNFHEAERHFGREKMRQYRRAI